MTDTDHLLGTASSRKTESDSNGGPPQARALSFAVIIPTNPSLRARSKNRSANGAASEYFPEADRV